jgi:hypothetical protein
MAGFKAKRGTENRSLDPCKINHFTRMECDNGRYHTQESSKPGQGHRLLWLGGIA